MCGSRGSLNHLILGAHRIWYLAPPDFADLLATLRAQYGDTIVRLLIKRLYKHLSAEELISLGVRRVLQPPGYIMVTSNVMPHLRRP